MRKHSVMKMLAWLMVLGAVIGGLIVFFKKSEMDDDDLFDDDIDDSDTCPGCSDTGRSYTTISKDQADAGQETDEKKDQEPAADEKED
ncbi:MAG: hypothetical protein ACOX8H_10265 [Ruminococcus sp.]|jgi:hypothetical protein